MRRPPLSIDVKQQKAFSSEGKVLSSSLAQAYRSVCACELILPALFITLIKLMIINNVNGKC